VLCRSQRVNKLSTLLTGDALYAVALLAHHNLNSRSKEFRCRDRMVSIPINHDLKEQLKQLSTSSTHEYSGKSRQKAIPQIKREEVKMENQG
jgi:hypothetical protein